MKTGKEILEEYRNQEQDINTFVTLEEMIDKELDAARSVNVDQQVMPNEVIAGGSKRWKPKEKEIFYYVNFYTGVTEQLYTNSKIHTPRNLYKIGNCYKTKEEAQMKWGQIKQILLQR